MTSPYWTEMQKQPKERLSLLNPAANSEGGLNIAAHKSFVQHVQKVQRVTRTTEEDVEKNGLQIPVPRLRKKISV